MTSILNMGGCLIDLGTQYQYMEAISTSDQDIVSETEIRLIVEASRPRGLDAKEAGELHGRARRARRAATLAFVLATADGPLPIGDMLAIGLLSAYVTYEVYATTRDFLD